MCSDGSGALMCFFSSLFCVFVFSEFSSLYFALGPMTNTYDTRKKKQESNVCGEIHPRIYRRMNNAFQCAQ